MFSFSDSFPVFNGKRTVLAALASTAAMDDEAKSMHGDVKIKGIDYSVRLTLAGDNDEQLLVELQEQTTGNIWKNLFEASCNERLTKKYFDLTTY